MNVSLTLTLTWTATWSAQVVFEQSSDIELNELGRPSPTPIPSNEKPDPM